VKIRVFVAMLFLLGLGTSGYYNHKAAAATHAPVSIMQNQASVQCCSGDPDGSLWPPPKPGTVK